MSSLSCKCCSLNHGSKNEAKLNISDASVCIYLLFESDQTISLTSVASIVSLALSTASLHLICFKTGITVDAVTSFSPARALVKKDSGFRISQRVSKIESSESGHLMPVLPIFS